MDATAGKHLQIRRLASMVDATEYPPIGTAGKLVNRIKKQ